MKRAYIRCYGELNDFLPPARKQVAFAYPFYVSPSVKDVIEGVGVPHTEIELILANGESVDFTYRVEDGDKINVYPKFQSIDITPLLRLRPRPLRELRFIADTHLGKLAAYLRMLGFDTLYRNDYLDDDLARISANEGRILLTMDRGLLKRAMVSRGYFIREKDPRKQVVEVLQRFDLFRSITPFQRCLYCNTLLKPTQKELVSHRLPPKTDQYYEEFHICPVCDRIYWKGSHYRRMQRFIESII